jgi:hypothetical protein
MARAPLGKTVSAHVLAFTPDPMASTDKLEQRRETTDQGAGYIRLYRKLLANPIWTQLAPAVLKVAIYFLLRAGYRPTQWYDGARTVHIPAGAFITSYDRVARDCKLSKQQVRDAFTHLSGTHFATYRRTHRWTLVIVCNWASYQASVDGAEHTQEHRVDHLRNTKQEVKNINTFSSTEKTASEGLFDINDPPFPKLEPEEIPAEENGKTHPGAQNGINGTGGALELALNRVADAIHQRHPNGGEEYPNARGRRNLSEAKVRETLKKILKHKKVPRSEQESYLEKLNARHAAMCVEWLRDGGQYAYALKNYLAVTEARYEIDPPECEKRESGPRGPIL